MMLYIEKILNIFILNNSLKDYLIFVLLFLFILFILKIFKTIVLKKLKKISQKTKTSLDDAIIDYILTINFPFYFIIALYFSLMTLNLVAGIDKVLNILLVVIVFYEVVKVLEKLVNYFFLEYTKEDQKNKSVMNFSKIFLKIIIWSVGLLMILSNLGVDISALIASLGIGGIAVALAMQNILKDLFSSVSIYIDKPFEVGDYITLGTDSGVVEKIGMKTTRLKTLRGEELVVSNDELTKTRINNFKKLAKRREVLNFGVIYDTPAEKLEKIPAIVEEIIKKQKDVDFDRSHFSALNDSSLDFETVYYINSDDYALYMDLKQNINLELIKRFKKEGIEFAYPSQTIYVNK